MPLPGLTVREVMSAEPVVVPADCPIREVMRRMNEYRIGAVMVEGAGNRLVGIFSERDLLRRIISAEQGWRDYPVADWMTREPHSISPDVGWDEAVGMMTRLRVRHLPVIDHGRVIGIVTSRALMSRRSEHLDRVIEETTREIREFNEALLARDTELRQNLRVAGKLQTQLMLPKARPDWTELDWAVHYVPLDHLGGDYYDYVMPSEGKIGLLIADASGHSIAAAMVAVMTRIAFAEVAPTTNSPGQVLTALNQRLAGVAEDRFVTAFYGVLDRESRTLRYAAAGHPDPLHINGRNGEVTPLAVRGFLLGIMPEEVYTEREVTLQPGDRLCFYTDGLIEARNSIGEQFGMERLVGCLRDVGRQSPGQIVESVIVAQQTFCEHQPATDDLTLVALGIGE